MRGDQHLVSGPQDNKPRRCGAGVRPYLERQLPQLDETGTSPLYASAAPSLQKMGLTGATSHRHGSVSIKHPAVLGLPTNSPTEDSLRPEKETMLHSSGGLPVSLTQVVILRQSLSLREETCTHIS